MITRIFQILRQYFKFSTEPFEKLGDLPKCKANTKVALAKIIYKLAFSKYIHVSIIKYEGGKKAGVKNLSLSFNIFYKVCIN